jgi:integrase
MTFHIFRREATYYWRRRTPRALAPFFDRPHVFMSLQTTSPVMARRLAVKLDVILEDAAMLAENANLQLSKGQVQAMLRAVVDRHLAKLERVAAAAKSSPGFDIERARGDDRRAFWTYSLLDAQGFEAVVRPQDRARMASEGLSEADIEAVQNHLKMLRRNDLVPTKPHILARLIEGAKAEPTAMNIAQTQNIYFRGMKLALAEVERRYGAHRIEDDTFVERMLRSAEKLTFEELAPVQSNETTSPKVVATAAPGALPVTELLEFAEGIIKAKSADEHWDDKTQRQARSITGLLVRFLQQDQRIDDLSNVLLEHIARFVDFLRTGIYKHYGRSPKDEHRTIAQLREHALTQDAKKRGIVGDTINRHLTFIGQIFRHAASRGAKALGEIDVSKLRTSGPKKRARDARPKLQLEKLDTIFQTPPFNNCADWNLPDRQGPEGVKQIFHRALYFVPILIYYTGCRREELCGALVDEVILDHGSIPYIHIAKNEQRRIKNPQSQRNIPLHPELIRLGFVYYVQEIKNLGYRLLFPDLFSPTTSSPMGDRFYKEFKPILTAAGVTEAGLGSHAVRHLTGAQLKKKLVTEEDRADLLGHSGDSETSERYCEPHELEALLKFLKKLPVITANLEPAPINLLPWVAEKKVAPFSQPSRSKRKKAELLEL